MYNGEMKTVHVNLLNLIFRIMTLNINLFIGEAGNFFNERLIVYETLIAEFFGVFLSFIQCDSRTDYLLIFNFRGFLLFCRNI